MDFGERTRGRCGVEIQRRFTGNAKLLRLDFGVSWKSVKACLHGIELEQRVADLTKQLGGGEDELNAARAASLEVMAQLDRR